VSLKLSEPGLAVIALQGDAQSITFTDFEAFAAYLKQEGLDHVAGVHERSGKPRSDIVEDYARCAKLLLKVGSGEGADRAVGLTLELVAERNPYALGADETLPVRLLYQGKPLADVQITAFSKAAPQERQHVRTDAGGRARIALPASGPWLLNAVHMVPPAPRGKAHWFSWWASMTFARP
jgi:uncharacterized GH25 family protein